MFLSLRSIRIGLKKLRRSLRRLRLKTFQHPEKRPSMSACKLILLETVFRGHGDLTSGGMRFLYR